MDLLESVGCSVQSMFYVSSLGMCLFELFVNLSNSVYFQQVNYLLIFRPFKFMSL